MKQGSWREKVMKLVFVSLILLCCTHFVSASQTIVINNAMREDLLIESVNTKGSVVNDSWRFMDMMLKNGEKVALRINIVSPVCEQKDNSVFLKVKNVPVYIRWGKEGVNLGKDQPYVNRNYRITQELDARGNIVFSFYDEDSKAALLNAAKARLEVIAVQQQKSSKRNTIKYSGITEEELKSE